MKRLWFVLAGLALLGLLFGLLALMERSIQVVVVGGDFDTWPPSAAALREQTGPGDAANPNSPAEIARRKRFAKLFEGRYRHHDPAIAIGMRMLDDKCIKLMCPARMEPWNMDRLALIAWRESKETLGHPFNIDIYETYIGAPPIKVGELRPTAKDAQRVEINYQFHTSGLVLHQSTGTAAEPTLSNPSVPTLPVTIHE